ncbi:MAG: hypothetical protein ACR2HR_02825 [Euzebya sp.]
MNRRSLGLLTLLASVVLLGVTAADWATVTTVGEFSEEVVIQQTQTVSGAEVAGPLFLVGLLGMVLAGLMIRWILVGVALAPWGILGIVVTMRGMGGDGAPTSAPYLALVACGAYVLLGGLSLRLASNGPTRTADRVANGGSEPSRYTVEAVRRDDGDGDDEWDLAVAEPDAGADPTTAEDDR